MLITISLHKWLNNQAFIDFLLLIICDELNYKGEEKMKKFSILLISFLIFTFVSVFSGCKMNNQNGLIVFNEDSLINTNYGGVGVEFDVYEHPEIIREDKIELIYERMDKLSPSLVRSMMNYSWFIKDFDDKGTEDITDDTWEYNWTNKNVLNMFEILAYCDENGIDVALGPWRSIDGVTNTTSDIRWAKVTARIFKEISDRGITSVKWFVPSNEPNYIAGNNYQLWANGVKNVYNEFHALGIDTMFSILGTDVSSYSDALNWADQLDSDTVNILQNYSVHLYVSDRTVDSGKLQDQVKDIVDAHQNKDSNFNKKGLIVWESGLIDGRMDTIDSNELIDTFNYGIRMVDYTIQTILGGANGIVYWELDDAAHFLPVGGNGTWGMFSSLGDAWQQELRPWFHSSQLLSAIFSKGSRIYSGMNEEIEGFRMIAGVSKDGNSAGVVAVNRTDEAVIKSFVFEDELKSDELYVYIFSEKHLLLGEDGYIIPNTVIQGNFNSVTEFEVPAGASVFITNHRI